MFGDIVMPFGMIVIVKDGFKSGHNRLVAGNTVKYIRKLLVRGKERMELPRLKERKMSKVGL